MSGSEKTNNLENITDKEWKQRIGKPEFMSATDSCIRGLVEDKEGNTWAFIDGWANWMYQPTNSAVVRINGDCIEIAVRAKWSDEESQPVPVGDSPLIGARQWREITGSLKPSSWIGSRVGIHVVKLPFRPREIYLVDKI